MSVRRGSFADEAFAVVADAFAGASTRWEQGIGAAIANLFDFLADRPEDTSACLVTDAVGSGALERRERVVGRFTAFLQPGFVVATEPPPPVVAEAVVGGVYEIVRRHVLERRLDELPEAVPDATVVALSPFVGADSAIALAVSANVQSDS